MKRLIYEIIVIGILMTTNHGKAQNIQRKLKGILTEVYLDKQPGAALLVIKNDTTLIRNGFGKANLEKDENITPETNFRMASVSKQFTAMAILLLQNRNHLDVNDPVREYLPTLPKFTENITIKQLLTHTSGIADYETLIPEKKNQVTDAEVLKMVSHSDSLYFSPGTDFRYSNTGFCLLTQIIEKIENVSYREFVRENIFEPFEMKNSLIYDPDKKIEKRAFGYHFDKEDDQWIFADQSLTSATMGDGSVYTSINAYEKWIKSLWEESLTDSIDNPLRPQVSIKNGLDYGYGWFTAVETDDSRAYFHSGETTGFHNIVYHNPSKETLVALFSNADDERAGKAFDQIMDFLKIRLKDIPKNRTLFDFLSEVYGD